MKGRWTIIAALAAFLVFVVLSDSKAVSTREIDRVRNKGVLDSIDFQIIDNFVREAVEELVDTKDSASIVTLRSTILACSSSKSSAQAQYAEQFSKSAHKYIAIGLQQAEKLTPQDRKFKVIVNLLLLMDGLKDLRLADLAMGLLNDENAVTRYLAVHSITSPEIVRKLNSSSEDDLQLGVRITEALKKVVDNSSPEVVGMIAKFAAGINIPQGEDLLNQIADMRIRKYADWTVDYELLDASILKLLYKKISSMGRSKPAVARRFAQLYSCGIQRYVKGRDYLNAAQKHQLASVLVEVEKSCIWKILGVPQTRIKRAVEKDDYMALLEEHSRLLGDETRAGKLAEKLKFYYGQTPDGRKRTAPLALPDPPEKIDY